MKKTLLAVAMASASAGATGAFDPAFGSAFQDAVNEQKAYREAKQAEMEAARLAAQQAYADKIAKMIADRDAAIEDSQTDPLPEIILPPEINPDYETTFSEDGPEVEDITGIVPYQGDATTAFEFDSSFPFVDMSSDLQTKTALGSTPYQACEQLRIKAGYSGQGDLVVTHPATGWSVTYYNNGGYTTEYDRFDWQEISDDQVISCGLVNLPTTLCKVDGDPDNFLGFEYFDAGMADTYCTKAGYPLETVVHPEYAGQDCGLIKFTCSRPSTNPNYNIYQTIIVPTYATNSIDLGTIKPAAPDWNQCKTPGDDGTVTIEAEYEPDGCTSAAHCFNNAVYLAVDSTGDGKFNTLSSVENKTYQKVTTGAKDAHIVTLKVKIDQDSLGSDWGGYGVPRFYNFDGDPLGKPMSCFNFN